MKWAVGSVFATAAGVLPGKVTPEAKAEKPVAAANHVRVVARAPRLVNLVLMSQSAASNSDGNGAFALKWHDCPR